MPEKAYRIKLYGHSAPDPELFCKNLAALLAVEDDAARILIAHTPVVIVDGLSKKAADHFLENLRSIQALCLAEESDRELPAAVSDAETLAPELPAVNFEELRKKDEARAGVWGSVLIGAAGLFFIMAVLAFFSSIIGIRGDNDVLVEQGEIIPAERMESRPKIDVEALQNELAVMEPKIEELRHTVRFRQEDFDRIAKTFLPNLDKMRQKERVLKEARMELTRLVLRKKKIKALIELAEQRRMRQLREPAANQ